MHVYKVRKTHCHLYKGFYICSIKLVRLGSCHIVGKNDDKVEALDEIRGDFGVKRELVVGDLDVFTKGRDALPIGCAQCGAVCLALEKHTVIHGGSYPVVILAGDVWL